MHPDPVKSPPRRQDGQLTEYYEIDRSPEREILDLKREGFDSIRLLGRYHYAKARPNLPTHSHGRMLEICYLESGRQTYVVHGREYELTGGDIFLCFPGERHGTGSHPEERGVLYWLLLSAADARQSLLNLPQREGHALLRRLLHPSRRQFRAPAVFPSILRGIFDCHAKPHDVLRIVQLRSLLLRLLLEVVAAVEEDNAPGHTEPIQAVLKHIDAHLEQHMGLPELADVAGLSLPRLKSRFKAETGISPADYILRRRIARATDLLHETDDSITAIATRLGFSSSQYFATVFKRYTFHSPGQARRMSVS